MPNPSALAGSTIDTIVVEPAHDGQRLDAYLAHTLGGDSRNRFKALIKNAHVSVGGRTIVEPNYRVNADEQVTVERPAPVPATPRGEAIPLVVIYEDDQLIVIDKPAGLVVHPAAGHWKGTLVNALIYHCGDSLSGIGGVRRPGIVHRIDKDTSGLLVVAKTDIAHRHLADQFADHGRTGNLRREYTALVWGAPQHRQGTIDAPLDRSSANRLRRAVVASGGKPAVTHFNVRATYALTGEAVPIAAQVTCRLETGRTHQIRVHMAHIGHPLIGDRDYAGGFKSKVNRLSAPLRAEIETFDRQALHASLLAFDHPTKARFLSFSSQLPDRMQAIVNGLVDLKTS